MKHTPDLITELGQNQIFVFGSNLAGKHNGGGARIAVEKFGAIYGQGIGIQGQSYAIPTLGHNFEKMTLDRISYYINAFNKYAFSHPENTFLVTKIGCGIAGYTAEQIAPLFGCLHFTYLTNVIMPKDFLHIQENACV